MKPFFLRVYNILHHTSIPYQVYAYQRYPPHPARPGSAHNFFFFSPIREDTAAGARFLTQPSHGYFIPVYTILRSFVLVICPSLLPPALSTSRGHRYFPFSPTTAAHDMSTPPLLSRREVVWARFARQTRLLQASRLNFPLYATHPRSLTQNVHPIASRRPHYAHRDPILLPPRHYDMPIVTLRPSRQVLVRQPGRPRQRQRGDSSILRARAERAERTASTAATCCC